MSITGINYYDSITAYDDGVESIDGKDDLGRDEFLTLLVAQLEHQDPLNPMDSSEFTAQLAQYSSLEQLFDINGNLEIMQTDQAQDLRYQAVGFIGKEVVVDGNAIVLTDGKTAKGSFLLGEPANCEVLVFDSEGKSVRSIPMEYLEEGEHGFGWDGRDDSGNIVAEGTYYFEVTATTDEGATLYVGTLITGVVDRVNLEGDAPTLFINDIPIPLSSALEFRKAGLETDIF